MSFSVVSYSVTEADKERSRITDLAIVEINGTPQLISTTSYDGVLQSWQIANGSLSESDTLAFEGDGVAGAQPTVTVIQGASGPLIQIGGGTSDTLQTIALNADGSFGAVTTLDAIPSNFAWMGQATMLNLASGQQAVYGSIVGEDGIASVIYTSTGSYSDHTLTIRSDPAMTNEVLAMASAAIDGQSFIFTANDAVDSLTSWMVAADGTLLEVAELTTDDGLWISAPQVMAMVQMTGVTYLVLGAAGSSTISVIEVGTDGALVIRDHLTDDRTTRFGGITALDIIQHNGQTHILAAGADDGVSVFQLLDGGYLVAKDHIVDTTLIGLDNVSAIAAIGRNDGLDIFVASSSEAGLTQLRYDMGTAGVTMTAVLAGGSMTGSAGNDVLQGFDGADLISAGDGDDIVRDGDGTDTMSGGAGADLFILSADGQPDVITDFTIGEDRLDLSLWPLLRDSSQLTMRLLPDGFEIIYGDELLTVESADGMLIDYRDLQNSDLLGSGVRLGTNIVPGYPGPTQPDPDIEGTGGSIPDGSQAFFSLPDAVSSLSGDIFLRLNSAAATQTESSADVLYGSMLGDIINAGEGADIIFGRAGDDQIDGGEGADVLLGGMGDDALRGGADGDVIRGGSGNDSLDGGAGDDLLIGDTGADTFIFNGGNDEIADFEQGLDQLVLDPVLWTGLTSASDVLAIYGSHEGTQAIVRLDADTQIIINGVTDFASLADDISLF